MIQFEPEEDTFYPRANEIIGFCSPSFPMKVVPDDKLLMVKTTKRSIAEWSHLFKTFVEDAAIITEPDRSDLTPPYP